MVTNDITTQNTYWSAWEQGKTSSIEWNNPSRTWDWNKNPYRLGTVSQTGWEDGFLANQKAKHFDFKEYALGLEKGLWEIDDEEPF